MIRHILLCLGMLKPKETVPVLGITFQMEVLQPFML